MSDKTFQILSYPHPIIYGVAIMPTYPALLEFESGSGVNEKGSKKGWIFPYEIFYTVLHILYGKRSLHFKNGVLEVAMD